MSSLVESQYIPAVEDPPAYHLVASPANSPLTHLEFALITLAGGEPPFSWESGDREAIFYLIEGGCGVNVSGSAGALTGTLGPRASVFDGPPSAVFVPAGSRAVLLGFDGGAHLALFSAPPSAARAPRIIGPGQVTVREVGADIWSRRVTSVADQSVTSRMLVGETRNPPGYWSSYPPHKHDTRRKVAEGRSEAQMEEIYHYLVRPPGGFGLQMVYTPPDAPAPFERIYRVRDGDTVVIPRGYHPVVAAGGYELLYLWVISGEQVEYAAWTDDPAHAWINRPR